MWGRNKGGLAGVFVADGHRFSRTEEAICVFFRRFLPVA